MRRYKGQSKFYSILEAILNITSGMVIAFSVTQFLAVPILGIEISLIQNAALTAVLTVVSVLRSYLWRRAFNFIHVKQYDKGK